MRNATQTLIGSVRKHVNIWRKREGWSVGTVASWIIGAHESNDGVLLTGIRFEPTTTDAYDRQRINGERIARWLDDETKDNNLLPANFIQSILLALPMDLRISCVSEILQPVGLSARQIAIDSSKLRACELVCAVAKEDGEATSALANLIDGATIDELQIAQRELTQSISSTQTALDWVETKLNTTHKK